MQLLHHQAGRLQQVHGSGVAGRGLLGSDKSSLNIRMRILYVEDDPRDADLTVRRLQKTAPQFQVETVSTIEEGLMRLERINSEPLDLVLADVHLSDGDGLSLLNHIRENRMPLAVVMVTGMGDEETAVAALKARADDYVVKGKDYLDR